LKTQQGYILLTVLIFMQICSLASLASLLHTANVFKLNNHIWQSYILQYRAHSILQKLEKEIELKPNCRIPITSSFTLTKQSLEWWKTHACVDHIQGLLYYYVIEALDIDECGLINSMNTVRVAAYYRITLFTLSDKLRYLLQSTVALPLKPVQACQKKWHHVESGRQMWREI
jgi:hypothetical protein